MSQKLLKKYGGLTTLQLIISYFYHKHVHNTLPIHVNKDCDNHRMAVIAHTTLEGTSITSLVMIGVVRLTNTSKNNSVTA